MLRFDKATYLSLLFQFCLSARLSNNLYGSDGCIWFNIFRIHKYSIHFVLYRY